MLLSGNVAALCSLAYMGMGVFHHPTPVPCNLSTISVHYKNLRFLSWQLSHYRNRNYPLTRSHARLYWCHFWKQPICRWSGNEYADTLNIMVCRGFFGAAAQHWNNIAFWIWANLSRPWKFLFWKVDKSPFLNLSSSGKNGVLFLQLFLLVAPVSCSWLHCVYSI